MSIAELEPDQADQDAPLPEPDEDAPEPDCADPDDPANT